MTPGASKVPRGEVRPDAPDVYVGIWRGHNPDGDDFRIVLYVDHDVAAVLWDGREIAVPRGQA